MSALISLSKSLLSLLPPGLAGDHVTVAHDRVVVAVRACASTAACPVCRRSSRRVHSRYSRRLGDLPWQGRFGQLDLQVRRFRCAAVECPRRIFAERLPAVALPKVRRTIRLSEAQRRIALSTGGEAGARLAACLAMPVSGDTLLRLIRAAPLPAMPTPRIIGIDDWSWRRGLRYGTIVVDLERNRPIDLLPDRHAETVAAWLNAYPGVEVVARDRAGAYAEGIRAGAPDAVQVADRWHLLRNLGDALAGVLDRHHHDLRAASKAVAGATMEISTAAPPSPAAAPLPTPAAELPTADRDGVRKARFDEVMALHGRGWPMKRIARTLGLNRKTVRVWVRAGGLRSGLNVIAAARSIATPCTFGNAGARATTTPPGCGGRSRNVGFAGNSAPCSAGCGAFGTQSSLLRDRVQRLRIEAEMKDGVRLRGLRPRYGLS